jgi:hypothetical protein
MLDRRVWRGRAQAGSEASGLRLTRAFQKHIKNHQKLHEILLSGGSMCAPQNAGSGLNGAVGFGPKTNSDGQCVSDPFEFQKQSKTAHYYIDDSDSLPPTPITKFVTEIDTLAQARSTI